MDRFISHWPGKSPTEPRAPAQPAVYHMLDVAAVAELLIAPIDIPQAWRDALILLTALHDLGKISNGFRAMLFDGTIQPVGPHWQMTEVLLAHHDPQIAGLLGGRDDHRQALYAATAGHHGRPPDLDLSDRRPLRAIGGEAIADASRTIAAFAELWPRSSLDGLTSQQVIALQWWLPGLVSAADWIGSNATWFLPQTPRLDLRDYLEHARHSALTAVNNAGLTRPEPSHDPVLDPDWQPSPMQAACADIDLPGGPILAVIEDETGAGKTEAALILAQRMMQQGRAHGLFFALPTTATADAMFARVAAMVRRLFNASPSLALAHGRSGLNDGYRQLVTQSAGRLDEVVCTEWLADNRRRALLATVGVGTVDQALLSILPTRFSTLRHYGLSSKVLIVDEAHELGEPYMAQELQQLLRAHRMAGGSAILLTATLPLAQRSALLSIYGANDAREPAYPALTIAGGPAKRDFPQQTGARGEISVRRLADADVAISVLEQTAGQGAACLWVRNAVDDAIAAVEALRKAGVQADLLHARFALCDRLRLELAALSRFGKTGTDRMGKVLVATQVVESSLDLDFDVMVSDLAPMAALIQRAGRLWRHMSLRPAAGRPVKGPVLHVVSPDPDQVRDDQWLHHVLDKGVWVYPLDVQWRTARALFAAGRIVAPAGLRALIEAAHGEQGEPVPDPLIRAEDERIAKGYAAANHARRNMIRLEEGHRLGAAGAQDADYPTRLGLPQKTLLLAHRQNGELQPLAGVNTVDGCQLSEVQVAESRLRGLDLPDQSSREIDMLTSGWPDWRRKSVIVCPMDPAGRICEGLRYDPEIGMVFE